LYERKAFLVQAAAVTADNMQDVAEWCGGQVLDCPDKYRRNGKDRYVKVPISVPPTMVFNERHGMAMIDDWVVFGQFGARGTEGWKVYKPRAFEAGFSAVTGTNQPSPVSPEIKALFDEIEPPCGLIEHTLDHEPCVLGQGHLDGKRKVGCRSFSDYKYA
jgi:hypothetical protein